jgi:hypothetical protein
LMAGFALAQFFFHFVTNASAAFEVEQQAA